MKPLQFVMKHYCGAPMLIFMDAEGPGDVNYRTWALCPICNQLGLIRKGRWEDPKQLSDDELFKTPAGKVV